MHRWAVLLSLVSLLAGVSGEYITPWCGQTTPVQEWRCPGTDYVGIMNGIRYADYVRGLTLRCYPSSHANITIGVVSPPWVDSFYTNGTGSAGIQSAYLPLICNSSYVADIRLLPADPPQGNVTALSYSFPYSAKLIGVYYVIDIGKGVLGGLQLIFGPGGPTTSPTIAPTLSPTFAPTTLAPSTFTPTIAPSTRSPTTLTPSTRTPTLMPTRSPTTLTPSTRTPTTISPSTTAPTTISPSTRSPSKSPTTAQPTSTAPTTTTPFPTASPVTTAPTPGPTTAPTSAPSIAPTSAPTATPSTTSSPAWWSVDYPSAFSVRDTVTFTLLFTSPSPSPSPSPSAKWVFSSGTITLFGTAITFTPTNMLLTYNFTAGMTYTFTTEIDGVQSLPYHFTITTIPLEVAIIGGNRDVLPSTRITLDARQSFDPNQIQLSDSPYAVPPALTFNWLLSGGCQLESLATDGVAIVQTAAVPGTLCTATVNVSSASPGAIWSSLTVSFRVVSSQLQCNVTLSGPSTMSPSDSALRLLASITGCSLSTITRYAWSSTPALKSGCSLPNSANSGDRAISVDPSCLQANVDYVFLFSIADGQGNNVSVWYPVSVLTLPSGGSCTVSPQNGVPLTTTFTVSCMGWNQTGANLLSLSYSLSARDVNGHTILISPPQYQPTFTTVLPSGSFSFEAQIATNNNAIATYTVQPSVTVSSPTNQPTNACPLNNVLTQNSNALTMALFEFTQLLQSAQSQSALCSTTTINATWTTLWDGLTTQVSQPQQFDYLVQLFSLLVQIISLTPTVTKWGSYNSSASNPPSSSSSSSSTLLPASLQNALVDNLSQLVQTQETLSPSAVTQLVGISSLLFPLLEGNCQASDTLTNLVGDVSRSSTAGDLPSDAAFLASVPGSGLSVLSSSQFGDSSRSVASGDGSSVLNVPASLAGQAGEVSSLTIVQYSTQSRDPSCRSVTSPSGSTSPTDSQMLLASSKLLDITLGTREGEAVAVHQISSNQFSFTLPISNTERCGVLTCGWWEPISGTGVNQTGGVWQTSGCTGGYYLPPGATSEAETVYRCTCTHLTEFSLLLTPTGCTTLQSSYLALFGVYIAVAALTLFKIVLRIRIEHYLHPVRKILGTPLMIQHILLLLLAVARAISCASLAALGMSAVWSMSSRAVAIILPYLLSFWNYTYLVFNWASILHFGMKYKDRAFAQVRVLFVASNLAVCAAVVAIVVILATPLSSSKSGASSSEDGNGFTANSEKIAIAATGTLALATFLTAVSFLGYAVALSRSMHPLSQSSGHRQKHCASSLKTKLLTGGFLLCLFLCIQSAMHVVSVTKQRTPGRVGGARGESASADISEIIVLIADILAILTMLSVYHKAMSEPSHGGGKTGGARPGSGSANGYATSTQRDSEKFSIELEKK